MHTHLHAYHRRIYIETQGVVDGGKSGAWRSGGRGDIVLNVDSGKLGLWPGGFLNLEAEGNWASSVNSNTGALMPVNSSQIFPLPGQNFDLIALNLPNSCRLILAGPSASSTTVTPASSNGIHLPMAKALPSL